MDATEKRSVARCLRGETSAWSELFKTNYRLAEFIARAPPFQFNTHEAEDIAQETMIELARKLANVENIKAFVGVVAHNKCVDRVRKKKEVFVRDLASDDRGEDPMERVLAPEPVSFELVDNESLSAIREAIDSLGDPCKSILFQRYFEELSYKKIAEQTAVPLPQVGVYLARCLARLRADLETHPTLWAELASLL